MEDLLGQERQADRGLLAEEMSTEQVCLTLVEGRCQMVVEGTKLNLLTDRRFFIENLILIPDKSRVPVPFHLNVVQEIIYRELWEDARYKRGIILKAGQMGCTSLIMALFLVDCITIPNTTSVVIAHEEFITQRLLAKAKIFEESIPIEFKPAMHHKSAYELSWEDIHSTFYIGSSRSFVFGRGERIDNALCSEIAFWSDPERITKPLGERVPITGRLLYESTPNGEDNQFHLDWVAAKKGLATGKAVFKPLFLPWWLSEDYKLGVDAGLEADAHSPLAYTDEEAYLVKNHQLTEEQIRWRRLKHVGLGEMFQQEYAEDDERCFLQIKESVFSPEILNRKAMDCYPPVGSYENAHVWFHPEPNHIYILGADPTVGRVKDAAAVVWDLLGLKQCARLSGLYEPPVFAQMIKSLGKYYNNALLVVESNNPGIAVLLYLLDYPNLYYQRDLITGKGTAKPGWTTTTQSKSYMIQQFKQLLPLLTIPDIELIREARNFRYNGLGVEAVGADDIMMAAMLALAVRDAAPVESAFVGTAGWKTW